MANMNELENAACEEFIHLTTTGRKTGKPRMVELWFAFSGGKVYLSHEGEDTDWMKNIKKNEQVAFEIAGKNFTGRARYLKDREDEAWIAKVALYEKYYGKASKEVIEDWFSLSRLLLIDDVCPGTSKQVSTLDRAA
jgi:deazaflavin-dependent oxidoreductase (nitroreductase family)